MVCSRRSWQAQWGLLDFSPYEVLVTQSCLILCDPMDCDLSESSVHGILQARNTGVGCHSLLQGIFPTQGLNLGLLHCRQILYHLSHQRNLLHLRLHVNMWWPKQCIRTKPFTSLQGEKHPLFHLLKITWKKWEIFSTHSKWGPNNIYHVWGTIWFSKHLLEIHSLTPTASLQGKPEKILSDTDILQRGRQEKNLQKTWWQSESINK